MSKLLQEVIPKKISAVARDVVTPHNLELRDKMALKTSLILLLSFISMHLSYSAKIAGFSGAASGSHYFNLKKVMEELVSRGHEVRSIERYLLIIYGGRDELAYWAGVLI